MYSDTQVCTQQIQCLRLFTVLNIFFRVVPQFAKSITDFKITSALQKVFREIDSHAACHWAFCATGLLGTLAMVNTPVKLPCCS